MSDTRTSTMQGTLAGQFAEICERFGERAALTLDGRSWSYAEMDALSDTVAAKLQELGAQPGRIVAICLERSIEMVSAMLGVVKTGAAYLPVDPAYPAARIEETLADAGPVVVISASGMERGTGLGVVPEDAAYVIYTSGSTGRPKGVIVSQGNLLRLFAETECWFAFDERDVWTMFHSFAFDFSVWELWGALLYGGRVVVVPFRLSRSPGLFRALLERERVTVLNQTPSAFALLDAADARALDGGLALRVVVFGGEALALGSLRGWFARHGDVKPQMVNMYGITETTVHVTYRRVRMEDVGETESLIGERIGDLTLELMDDQMQPVAEGAEGEICIGGAGVAQGYLGRPELTAERFVDGIYRSGDMARRRADGELVYLGRRDGQVKVNGFRIEVGEVEAALALHPDVAQACVVVSGAAGLGSWLQAYVVGRERASVSGAELNEFLSGRLPGHMVPAFFEVLQELPLTVNGKVDRSALPEVALGSEGVRTHRDGAVMNGVESGAGIEGRVAVVWRRVLGLATVGVEENFFDVGGTSLLLVAVRAGLQTELGREIPVVWMFECTTIKALAERLAETAVATPAETRAAIAGNAIKQRAAFARARAMRGAQ